MANILGFSGVFNQASIAKIIDKYSVLKTKIQQARQIDKVENIWGYGLAHKLPAQCEFGDVSINLYKLYHKNILSVSSRNKLKIMGFPNTRISDAFVSLIMNLCKNNNVTSKDLKCLNLNEKELYELLIHVAKLQKDVPNNSEETIENLKHRCLLIQGEVEAGNDNPELLKELYGVLTKMVHFNLITQSEFKRYYKQVEAKI